MPMELPFTLFLVAPSRSPTLGAVAPPPSRGLVLHGGSSPVSLQLVPAQSLIGAADLAALAAAVPMVLPLRLLAAANNRLVAELTDNSAERRLAHYMRAALAATCHPACAGFSPDDHRTERTDP